MENVPWHDEVLHFVRELNSRLSGGAYDIASEHEHSNCVLIAHKKFLIAHKWHTWDAIQYTLNPHENNHEHLHETQI